jgi:hypothetical protein
MSDKFISYLQTEHQRLEREIEDELKQLRPDDILLARLKKLKLVIKDQIARHESANLNRAA